MRARDLLRIGGPVPVADFATITLTPRNGTEPLGPGHDIAVRAIAGDAMIGSVIDHADGTYSAQVRARVAGEIWLSVAIDGHTMPHRVRLRADAYPISSIMRSICGTVTWRRC